MAVPLSIPVGGTLRSIIRNRVSSIPVGGTSSFLENLRRKRSCLSSCWHQLGGESLSCDRRDCFFHLRSDVSRRWRSCLVVSPSAGLCVPQLGQARLSPPLKV